MASSHKLPDEIREKVIGDNDLGESKLKTILEQLMKPVLHDKDDEQGNRVRSSVHLDKNPAKKWPKGMPHKSKFLPYNERRKLGLYSVGRDSLKYNDLLPLHKLWKDYFKTYMNFKGTFSNWSSTAGESNSMEQVSVKLFRADYHGAVLTVRRSKCPGYVGKSGIVAMETKNCFLLLGKDDKTRRIPKGSCEFTFQVDGFNFSFFGKNFLSRPADRSSRKIKTVYPPSL